MSGAVGARSNLQKDIPGWCWLTRFLNEGAVVVWEGVPVPVCVPVCVGVGVDPRAPTASLPDLRLLRLLLFKTQEIRTRIERKETKSTKEDRLKEQATPCVVRTAHSKCLLL